MDNILSKQMEDRDNHIQCIECGWGFTKTEIAVIGEDKAMQLVIEHVKQLQHG